jgi:hypothetical protein
MDFKVILLKICRRNALLFLFLVKIISGVSTISFLALVERLSYKESSGSI